MERKQFSALALRLRAWFCLKKHFTKMILRFLTLNNRLDSNKGMPTLFNF
jgi:hypothetical protein